MHDVFVAADRRGCGIGRALMARLIAATRGIDGASVTLFVMDDNAVALGLYRDLGFVKREGMSMFILGVDRYRIGGRASE